MNINKVKINNELIFRFKHDFFMCRLEDLNSISLGTAPTQHRVGLKSQSPDEIYEVQVSSHIFTYEFVGHPFSLCSDVWMFCVWGMWEKYVLLYLPFIEPLVLFQAVFHITTLDLLHITFLLLPWPCNGSSCFQSCPFSILQNTTKILL